MNYDYSPGFGGFDLFDIMFIIVFLLVIGTFVGILITGIRQLPRNKIPWLCPKGVEEMNRLKMTGFLAGMALILCLAGCGKQSEDSNFLFTAKEDFAGRDIATITGTVVDGHVDEVLEGIQWHYYDDQAGGLEALKKGDVDAAIVGEPIARVITAQQPEFAIFPEMIVNDTYGFILKKGSPLTERFSEVISEFTKDGTLNVLQENGSRGMRTECALIGLLTAQRRAPAVF